MTIPGTSNFAQVRACRRCIAFVEAKEKPTLGTCRANPPSPVPLPRQDLSGKVAISVEGFHPLVAHDHWCMAFSPVMADA